MRAYAVVPVVPSRDQCGLGTSYHYLIAFQMFSVILNLDSERRPVEACGVPCGVTLFKG